jgi:hypothetical protein
MEPDETVTAFEAAIDEVMRDIRATAGRYPICPRCFVELLADRLDDLLASDRGPGHAEPLPELNADIFGPAQGTA